MASSWQAAERRSAALTPALLHTLDGFGQMRATCLPFAESSNYIRLQTKYFDKREANPPTGNRATTWFSKAKSCCSSVKWLCIYKTSHFQELHNDSLKRLILRVITGRCFHFPAFIYSKSLRPCRSSRLQQCIEDCERDKKKKTSLPFFLLHCYASSSADAGSF